MQEDRQHQPYFDKADQLQKIQDGFLLEGEVVHAVFDAKGAGTGFVAITSKRVIVQDNAFVYNTKAMVSIPYDRINAVAADDSAGWLGGRGFFSSSKVLLTTSGGTYALQFRGADKAHYAHNMILQYMLRG